LLKVIAATKETMAIGDACWELVVKHTFVEMVKTENKQVRAKSEGGMPLPSLPSSSEFTECPSTPSVHKSSVRLSSRNPPLQRELQVAETTASACSQPTVQETLCGPVTPTPPGKPNRVGWCARICGAVGQKPIEDKGQSLKEVQSSSAHGAKSSSSLWRVVMTNSDGVGVRPHPLFDGKVDRGMRNGESFRVTHERVGKDGVVHLCLADGSGWVPSTKPCGKVLCERTKTRHRASQESSRLQVVEKPKSQTFNWCDETDEEVDQGVDALSMECRTTVVMTEIPSDCSRDGLVACLDGAGLVGQYNFVYLPVSFETLSTHGYGIVNFVSSTAAQKLIMTFPGSASWSDQRQGLKEHVSNFQDSSLMHEGVPDQFKPILFKAGKRVAFPAPTRQMRMPRELKRAICRMKSGELASNCNFLEASEGWTPKAQSGQCWHGALVASPESQRGNLIPANFRRIRSRRDRRSVS